VVRKNVEEYKHRIKITPKANDDLDEMVIAMLKRNYINVYT